MLQIVPCKHCGATIGWAVNDTEERKCLNCGKSRYHIEDEIKNYIQLSKQVSKLEKEIKAYISKHGNINIDGKAYGEYPLVKNVRKVDASLLANCAINAGYSRDDFYAAVIITLKNAKPIADTIGLSEEAYTVNEQVVQRGFGFVPEKNND